MLNQKLMMLRNNMLARGQLISPLKRGFSSQNQVANNTPAYIASAIGLGGLAYVAYNSSSFADSRSARLARGESVMSEMVQTRLAHTFGYFGFGIMSTSAVIYQLRNSMAWQRVPSLALLGGSIALLLGTHMLDYQTNFFPKLLCFTAFTASQGLAILPLIQMSALATVADAALATGLSMTALGTVAYNAPSEQFLGWAGPLSFGCMGLLGISVLSMFRPQSRALYNIWLYGGLALAGGLVLYRTQRTMMSAKTELNYDPINHGIGFYLDAVNIFIRILMIMNGNKKK